MYYSSSVQAHSVDPLGFNVGPNQAQSVHHAAGRNAASPPHIQAEGGTDRARIHPAHAPRAHASAFVGQPAAQRRTEFSVRQPGRPAPSQPNRRRNVLAHTADLTALHLAGGAMAYTYGIPLCINTAARLLPAAVWGGSNLAAATLENQPIAKTIACGVAAVAQGATVALFLPTLMASSLPTLAVGIALGATVAMAGLAAGASLHPATGAWLKNPQGPGAIFYTLAHYAADVTVITSFTALQSGAASLPGQALALTLLAAAGTPRLVTSLIVRGHTVLGPRPQRHESIGVLGIRWGTSISDRGKTPVLDSARALALPVCVALGLGVTLAAPDWSFLLGGL
jgi:hypothetical protein